ncbi:NAD-dependent epimerase/dehydratase family protein [Sandarakinorhabdus oryzae]|uniref:NAD-dependent epimerase/dehydratase family protein n=1 Tax=Sandarakinorhabdus oryzae TaxID=2675220 RepID=UPI0012E135BC|nr:GDP-mannose 4,6-dehydratase [Sandarakinorhabdus oryzae]
MTTNSSAVMITGVAGLIGSHLAETLLAQGHQVFAMDVVDPATCHNLDLVRDHPAFHYTKGDIRDPAFIKAFFRPDAAVLYHLASVVGVNRYMEDPLSLIDIAIIGTRNLIELCERHGVRMLFTSTSEVYGRNPAVPWREDDDRVLGATNVDRWSYSASKGVCEHMLFGMHHKSGWPMSIVRFFNVYGPRQNPIYVVSKAVHRVLNGVAPELYDGGQQTRCLTYIGDVIGGVIAAANSDAAIGQAINLGNPVENTMAEVVQMVLEEAGSSLTPIPVDTGKRYGDVYEDIGRRVPAVDKAAQLLGWRATTSARQGIANTIAWARENPWYLA